MPNESEPPREKPGTPSDPGLQRVVRRNVKALAAMRREFEDQKKRKDRIADAITRFTGSMAFVILHLLLFGAWFVFNLRLVPGVKPWDPYPFVMLAMIASVEAIFLSTFVLISQNRMQILADKRADLDVQINLLAEHELTRLIALVDAIGKRMGVEPPADVKELEVDVHPGEVLDTIERERRSPR